MLMILSKFRVGMGMCMPIGYIIAIIVSININSVMIPLAHTHSPILVIRRVLFGWSTPAPRTHCLFSISPCPGPPPHSVQMYPFDESSYRILSTYLQEHQIVFDWQMRASIRAKYYPIKISVFAFSQHPQKPAKNSEIIDNRFYFSLSLFCLQLSKGISCRTVYKFFAT